MIKRPTWILLILLALVIGAYILIKNHSSTATNAATPTALGKNFLFTDADGTLQNLLIRDAQGATFQMLRDPSGTWMIAKPTVGKADQALASAADTQVGALRIVTALDTPLDLDIVQLSRPAYIIEATFSQGGLHRLEVGTLTPTSSGYYVRLDGEKIYVVSQSGIDALLKLLKNPPYPATATPLSTATAAPEAASLTPTP